MAVELTGAVSGMLRLMGAGDTVDIDQVVSSGVKIATFVINEGTTEEQTIDLYAPDGTTSYTDLEDKPSINNHVLSGNISSSELGLSYNDLSDTPSIPSITAGLGNPSGGNSGDIYIKLHVNDTPIEHSFTPTWSPSNSWHEVDNPYFDGFIGYSGTFTFQGNAQNISKTSDEIPVYNSTVQNDPSSYKFWSYSAYKWCSIARSADNKKLYFYDNAGNASYTAQKVLTQSDDVDGFSGIYYNYNGTWLSQVS